MQETQYDKKYSDLFRFRKSVMIFVAKVKSFCTLFCKSKDLSVQKGISFTSGLEPTYILHMVSEWKKITLKIVIGDIISTPLQIIFIEFKKILKAIVI